MSTLQRIVRRRSSKFFAVPAPRIRDNRPRRPATPFGAGLLEPAPLAVYAVPSDALASVVLTENEFWYEEPDPADFYRYTVRSYRDGELLGRQGFDVRGDADLFARILVEKLAVLSHPDEAPAADEAPFEPSGADRLWWSQHCDEVESELSFWLDHAAPDDYMDRLAGEARAEELATLGILF